MYSPLLCVVAGILFVFACCVVLVVVKKAALLAKGPENAGDQGPKQEEEGKEQSYFRCA